MKHPEISQLYQVFLKYPNVIIDSRKAARGTIFLSLKGDNFDGNEFAESAIKQGCEIAIIDNERYYKGDKYILVKDGIETLQEMGKHHRENLKIPFIAITGSNGKTTTKELIKCVLAKKYKVLATSGNLNNHIGVPLTILSIASEIDVAVIEMGANHVGEIATLCEIAQPDYGLITNIGKAHLGEFGGFENVVKTKAELYQYIRNKNGKVFIDSGNDLLNSLASGIDKIAYGISETAYCSCRLAGTDPFLKVNYENKTISSQLIGKYNFENIAAAICVGKYFAVENEKIKEAIEEYIPSNNRSQILKTQSNTLLLDAYNANPTSMEMAIKNFAETEFSNKMVILGDMRELGSYSKEEHEKIFELIRKYNFSKVFLVGDEFCDAAKGSTYKLFNKSDELASWLKDNPIKNSSILIKGSRGIKLEKVVEFL